MAENMGLLAVMVVALATTVSALRDTSVCTPFKAAPSEPMRPNLPTTFEVHVEANIHNKGYTADYHEWFDNPNKRAAAHVDKNSTRQALIWSFTTNELFTIDRITGKCTVSKLSTSPMLFLFGSPTADHQGAVIYNASTAFHFGGAVPEKWMGNTTTIRGIQVNQWRSCMYWKSTNSTMTVDWFFSVGTWQTSTLNMAVPVRAQVAGNTWSNGVARAFNHTYEFMDFLTTMTHLTAFETPPGVYCPKRKMTKPLPSPAAAFHFTAEIVIPSQQAVAFIKEYYDYDLGLVRYDRTPVTVTPYGTNPLTTIHDFNTGVSYHIDDVRGNCTPTSISRDTFDVHDVHSDPTHVRIRTDKEFFYFDKTNYTYEGTRAVRDMLADVWITRRTDWRNTNSTWEWYFLTNAYTADIPDTLKFGMPIRMVLYINGVTWAIYNIYDYDERRPDIWSFDISACFSYTQKRDFSFLLPGSFRVVASSNTETFKYAVIKGITKAGSIDASTLSALRIINIGIDYADNNDIIVKFTLLDKAPPVGDVSNPKKEQDLNTVASSISNAINGGTFVVKMMANGNPVIMKARPFSLTPTQNVVQHSYYKAPSTIIKSGSSGGVMAGMAIALLVIAFTIGVVTTYMFYRRRGGAFLPKKFDNTDITQDDS